MARTLANSAECSKSQLNCSPSKQIFSFSKSPRFPEPKVYCDNIYNKPSAITSRGASIGYGNRFYRATVSIFSHLICI